MKILVTGAEGQVGLALCRLLAARRIPYVACTADTLDITREDAVRQNLDEHRPDYLVNCAAYTDVDGAEQDRERCFFVNREGPSNLACCCADLGVALVHLSSDQVFDGTKTTAYAETDTPNPLSVYGRSKWEGEEAVRQCLDRHIIIRSAWVFGPDGDNFLQRILRLAVDEDSVAVVNDQFGCPTPAADLARVIVAMLEQVDCDVDPPLWGTYHYVGSDVTDWHTFAEAIVKAAKSYVDVKVEKVEAVSTASAPARAPRPVNAELSTRKILATFGIKQQPWRRGIQEALKAIFEPANEGTASGE